MICDTANINTKVTNVFHIRCCRVAPWDPLKKTTFTAEFCDELYIVYLYTKNNRIPAI